MTNLTWEEPPGGPGGAPREDYTAWFEALAERAGEWARWPERFDNRGTAYSTVRSAAQRRGLSVQLRTANEEGETAVWVRVKG